MKPVFFFLGIFEKKVILPIVYDIKKIDKLLINYGNSEKKK